MPGGPNGLPELPKLDDPGESPAGLGGGGGCGGAVGGSRLVEATATAATAAARTAATAATTLVATEVASRGLDIRELPQVVNFELPNVPEDYVHRIGRTGRAGAAGNAISLVDKEEVNLLTAIERLIKRRIDRAVAEDFVPSAGAEAAHEASRVKSEFLA